MVRVAIVLTKLVLGPDHPVPNTSPCGDHSEVNNPPDGRDMPTKQGKFSYFLHFLLLFQVIA